MKRLINRVINTIKRLRRWRPVRTLFVLTTAVIVTGGFNALIAFIRWGRCFYDIETPNQPQYFWYFWDNIIKIFGYFGSGSVGSIVVLSLILLVFYLSFAESGFKRFFAGLNITLRNFEKYGLRKIGSSEIYPGEPLSITAQSFSKLADRIPDEPEGRITEDEA